MTLHSRTLTVIFSHFYVSYNSYYAHLGKKLFQQAHLRIPGLNHVIQQINPQKKLSFRGNVHYPISTSRFIKGNKLSKQKTLSIQMSKTLQVTGIYTGLN